VPTSKRPQVDDVQYLRIPSRILKAASREEVVNDEAWQGDVNLEHMECIDNQISCIAARSLAEPPEACRPQEGLKYIAPKHPEAHGRAIRRTPHRDAFTPDVNPRCPEQTGRVTTAHRPQKVTRSGRPTRLAGS
jgi:hypothetical protein